MKALAFWLFLVPGLVAQSLTGTWDATVVSRGVTIPFHMEFASHGSQVQATFFNAGDKIPSTSGRLENGALLVKWDQLATRLEAKYENGRLEGMYYGSRVTGILPFRAQPAAAKPKSKEPAPAIAGEWELDHVKSGKRESAWRFLVQQSGPDVSAAILRVDGDTGMVSGTYQDGKFVLSNFSGARAYLMIIEPRPDGSLHLTVNGTTEYTALRPKVAREEGLAGPANPDLHTSVKDPSQPFHFAFRDLNGTMVTSEDERFRNKVVIVSILGSWCPNCHDEAPYLVELYRKYHDRGLEIVGLSFEEEDQLANPARLRAFVKEYGIEYPMLVPGEPSEISAKLPQLKDFDAWPTILLLGRDGRVRRVHAGFPSGGSGVVYTQTKHQIAANVEQLLAENASAAR